MKQPDNNPKSSTPKERVLTHEERRAIMQCPEIQQSGIREMMINNPEVSFEEAKKEVSEMLMAFGF